MQNQKGFVFYSPVIRDSFVISLQLPEEYQNNTMKSYPVVYLTDANFHFSMLAATLKQYEKNGLLPPLILVGVGYKSYELMDSLGVRDYMYPAALPSDEMNAVGGGRRFDSFIVNQLMPYIDSTYHTDKANRTLLGHSFGGYFSLLALLDQIETKRNDFKNFVSASPSLWYNDFYLNQLPGKLKELNNKDSIKVFLSVGGLEDSTWNVSPVKTFAKQIEHAGPGHFQFQCRIYNDLEHMDVAQLSFVKGLQQFYNHKNN
ncbi:alpha/beta hydrolase [Terrimonas pollutisoli]|uniref:alpha/beta hydrolase n=1 Tax=Terrimonas pollutisoli TaxID=3034147 RepID=UPI0023EDF24A|nr:alpha/beta hydrolase-fold protein [Terrimonas sp. H1YJ31]